VTDQPDLSTLPARRRYAAEVLGEASGRCPDDANWWSPYSLCRFADKWEAEDREKADREALVEELVRDVSNSQWWQPKCMARTLIDNGWTKAADA
jgi:hypothetical protein